MIQGVQKDIYIICAVLLEGLCTHVFMYFIFGEPTVNPQQIPKVDLICVGGIPHTSETSLISPTGNKV